ncbi:separin-like isoform X2 [Ptychodera flava]|uniref:separin-like isoform X2 n=1 Tax=Ptychodera flava TaxID=63121 RepID=UPI00396A0B43
MAGYSIIKALKDGQSPVLVLKETQKFVQPLLVGKVSESEVEEYGVFGSKMLRQCVMSLADGSDSKDEIFQICGYTYQCICQSQTAMSSSPMAIEKLLFHVMVHAAKLSKPKEVGRFAGFLYRRLSESLKEWDSVDENYSKSIDNIAKQSFNTLYKASLDIKEDGNCHERTLALKTMAVKFALLSQSDTTWALDHAWKVAVPVIRSQQKTGYTDNSLEQYFETVDKKVTERIMRNKENNCMPTVEDISAILKWTIKYTNACSADKGLDVFDTSVNNLRHILDHDSDMRKRASVCLSIIKLGLLLANNSSEVSSVLDSVQKHIKWILAKGLEADILQCVILACELVRKKLENNFTSDTRYSESVCVLVCNFLSLQIELLQFRSGVEDSTTEQRQQDMVGQFSAWNIMCRVLITALCKDPTTKLQNLCRLLREKIHNILEMVSSEEKLPMLMNEHNIVGTNCYNLGITLYKADLYSECTEQLQLACQQLYLWCCHGNGVLDNDRQEKVQLLKKYELLINCQRKNGCHSDAMETASSAISIFGQMPDAVQCLITLWIKAKHDGCKLSDDVQLRTKTLKDCMKDEDLATVTAVLKLEYDLYKKQSFETDFEEYGILCDLLTIYDGENQTADIRAYYLIQLVKLLYITNLECDCKIEDCSKEAVSLLEDCLSQRENAELADLLAVAYVWHYISQSTISNVEDTETDGDVESVSMSYTLSQEKDAMKPLYKAYELWQGLHTPYDVSETCHTMVLMGAIFHLHCKELETVMTLQLLGNTASQASFHSQAAMAYADAAKRCCYLGNQSHSESLMEKSRNSLAKIKWSSNNTEMVSVTCSLKQAWCLVYCKKFSEAATLLKEIGQQPCIERSNRWAYLLKAELKELQAKYLMACGFLKSVDDDTPQELLYEVLRLRQGVDKLAYTGTNDGTSKAPWGLDNWSIRAVLMETFYQVGCLYNKLGSVREARCYLSEGLVLANRLQLPTRCAQYLVELSALTIQCGVKVKACQNYLQNVKDIIFGTETHEMKKDVVKDVVQDDGSQEEDDFIISKPIDFMDYISDTEDDSGTNSPPSPSNFEWSPTAVEDIVVNRIQLRMGVVYLEYLTTYSHDAGSAVAKTIDALHGFKDDAHKVIGDQMDVFLGGEKKERKKGKLCQNSGRFVVDVDAEVDFLSWIARYAVGEHRLDTARKYVRDADALWDCCDAASQAKILYHKALLQLVIQNGDSQAWGDAQWLNEPMIGDADNDVITDLSVRLDQCQLSPVRNCHSGIDDVSAMTPRKLKLTDGEIDKLEQIEKCFSVKKGRKPRKTLAVDDSAHDVPGFLGNNDDTGKTRTGRGRSANRRHVTWKDRDTSDENDGKTSSADVRKSRKKSGLAKMHGKTSQQNIATTDGEGSVQPVKCSVMAVDEDCEAVQQIYEFDSEETTGERKRSGKSNSRTRNKGVVGVQSRQRRRKKEDMDEVFFEDSQEEIGDIADDPSDDRKISKSKTGSKNISSSVKTTKGRKVLGEVTRNSRSSAKGTVVMETTSDVAKEEEEQCEEIVTKRSSRSRRKQTEIGSRTAVRSARTRQSRKVKEDGIETEKVRFVDEADVCAEIGQDLEELSISSESDEECQSPDMEYKCLGHRSLTPLAADQNYRSVVWSKDEGWSQNHLNNSSVCGEGSTLVLSDDDLCDIEIPRSKDSDSEDEGAVLKPRRKMKGPGTSRKQTGKSGTDLSSVIEMLQKAYDLCQSFGPTSLCLQICQLLSWCHGNRDTPCSAARYLNESFANTLRHQKISTIYKKLRKLRKENNVKEVTRLQQDRQVFVISEDDDIIKDARQQLPQGWSICNMSVINIGNQQHMVLSRIQRDNEPIIVKIPIKQNHSKNLDQIMEEFANILAESKRSVKEMNKQTWWRTRKDLDNQLQVLLQDLENSVLQCWKVLLPGNIVDDQTDQEIKKSTCQLYRLLAKQKLSTMQKQLLQSLLEGHHWLSERQVQQGISWATGMEVKSPEFQAFYKEYESLAKKLEDKHDLESIQKHPVILILDKTVQRLPWECIPILYTGSVCRMPSLRFVLSHIQQRQYSDSVLSRGVNPSKTSYVINPSSDLVATQTTFLKWFSRDLGWSGVAGRAPTTQEYKAALLDQELFIYCGHGTGRQYLHGDDIQQLECKAVSLLMGCSSGRLQATGNLECTGMVLYYLLAGCPCVVGALWDITDKDADRYLEALLKSWLPSNRSSGDILQHISSSREACRLGYLIGAAQVVYGLPVSITPSSSQ